MTAITYVLYTLDESGNKKTQQASTSSRQDAPDLKRLLRQAIKTSKNKPVRNSYYITEAGGCLYLKAKTTGKPLYTLCPVYW